MNALLAIAGLIIAFVVGLFISKKGAQQDAKVIDLTAKIKENQDAATKQQVDADQKVKDYEDARAKLDTDDGDGKPSA